MRKIVFELLTTKTDQEIRERMGIDRTIYKGICTLGPSIGNRFTFYFDRDGGERYDTNFVTSTVKHIQFESSNMVVFKTKNSTYKITFGEAFNE